MARRKFIFRDLSGSASPELVLPVTPDRYQVETGVNVEVVNIHALGDAVVMGYGTLATININCMFPSRSYSFSTGGGAQSYIQRFEKWVREKTDLRFIVGGTGVNIPVRIQSFSYGERDGTNDIYADIILREYRSLKPARLSGSADSKARAAAEPSGETKTHPIVPGDTLSAICRKYYGDGSPAVYKKLAAYNNIPNPDLIYAGNTLTIPFPLV